MIEKKNKKLGKKYLGMAITAATLVLLIVAYIVINAVISSLTPDDGNGTVTLPEILSGESIYGSRATIYPYLSPDSIIAIQVNKFIKDEESGQIREDSYMMSKPKDDDGNRQDYFIFSYMDPYTERLTAYLPDILFEDANFNYSDLYAVETSTGLGARKIDYLCAAIGALYFDERIPLSTDPEQMTVQLNRYGLAPEDRETVSVTYLDENGQEKIHTLYVGNKPISGSGYYFMLKDRNYIYTSQASENLSYALGGFEAFIDARITAEEVEGDKGAAPYHTNRYSQWTSKYYTVLPNSNEILTVPSGVDIVINANYIQLLQNISVVSNNMTGEGSGYRYSGIDQMTVKNTEMFKSLYKSLVGKNVGAFSENIIYTLLLNKNEATLFDTESGKGEYEYTIYKIEAIVTDTSDITEIGATIPDGSKIKIEYSYTVDGVRPSSENSHAVIDLSASDAIPAEVKAALKAAGVGNLSSPEVFTVRYTEENTTERKIEYIISEISLITDEKGNPINKITEKSLVNFEYFLRLDGQRLGESEKYTLDLGSISENSGIYYNIKQRLIGKSADDRLLSTTVTLYCQPFMDFDAYEISGIEGYISLEETVRFSFVPEDRRDPFNAESIYENTLPTDNKYSSYAMNNESCDAVLRLLGGIGTGSTSSGAQGLVGKETVAVGLSHRIMEKYKLYDGYRIYFELPRGLISGSSDYAWFDRIGFTLYIGTELQPDGTIYVACDMYDTVVKIDASTFDYLKFSFSEYWAKRNLVLVDATDIESLYVKLDYEDLYGEYKFDFKHTPLYIVDDTASTVKPESGNYSEYDYIALTVRSLSDRRTETLFSRIIDGLSEDSEKVNFYSLASIYNIAGGNSPDNDIMQNNDTLGTASMKEMLRMIYSTYYLGILNEQEQQAATEDNKLMELEFNLGDKTDYIYHYDFYRIDDRRIMVSLYRIGSDGIPLKAVSDFYISNLAFKKTVSGFISLLNGEQINADKAY